MSLPLRDLHVYTKPNNTAASLITLEASFQNPASFNVTLVPEKSSVNEEVKAVIHDIRGPLTNVMLAADYIKSEAHNPELNLYIDIINRSVKRIDALVSSILKPAMKDKTSCCISSVLMDAIDLSLDGIRLKNVTQVKHFSSSECYIDADADKLITAFLNLITNAIEAVRENEGVISVKTFVRDGKFHIEISDNGMGMSREKLGRLFTSHFTGKPTGMGIGLPVTKAILQSYNAEIFVTSEENHGATFTIVFEGGNITEV